MTLNTRIYIQGPEDPESLYSFINPLIGGNSDTHVKRGEGSIYNAPDQGLAGWLEIDFGRDGGPYRAEGVHDEYCPVINELERQYLEPGEEPSCVASCTPCWIKMSIDTAYSYSDAYGGCTILHARLIVSLHEWLQQRNGTPFSWQNEYTGEVHKGLDGLDDFIGSGEKAMEWFTGTVKPAIEKEIESRGGRISWQ